MSRYDFPIPAGWFDVGVSRELEPGGLRQIRVFDQELMLWRGQDGRAHLQSAYCPHLGANIPAHGRVQGDEVECAFHHWRFDGNGAVASIPYAPEAKTRACLRNYPVREFLGAIMAWHHPDGAPPSFELPDMDELRDPAMRGPLVETHEANTCAQELLENAVDGAHFVSIHKHPGPAAFDSVTFDGSTMAAKTIQEFPSSRGPVNGTLDTYSYGLGFGVIRYKTLIELTMVQFIRPIERERTQLRFEVYYKNPDDNPKVDRIAAAFYREVNRQVQEDIPIWNTKIYHERPMLTEGEGQVKRFRGWVKQFYPGYAPCPRAEASAAG